MDKDFFNKILYSNLHEDKIKKVQDLLNNVSDIDFLRGSDNFQNPIPKSQNHSNTINNSVESQEAIQNMLNRLNNKKDESSN